MTSYSPPLLLPRSGALPVNTKCDISQYFVNLQCTDLHKLVKEVGGEAEGQEGLPSQKHIVAPGNRIGLMAKGVSNPPDCLPEVGDEDEGVGESQQGGKSSAMENLWIWTMYIHSKGVKWTIQTVEKDENWEEPIMLGCQIHLLVRCQLPRSWSRTITITKCT